MSKFKVGDRVRRIHCNNGDDMQVGRVGTIKRVYANGDVIVDVDGGSDACFCMAEYLELATLTIQPGKYYLTRDGRKVGPMYRVAGRWIADNMMAGATGNPDDDRLVAEAEETNADILNRLEHWMAEQGAARASADSSIAGSTAGFTVPLCAYEDEPGWYATELGRAYADGYAAGLLASQTQAA